MIRSARVLIVAIVLAVSLLGSASVASADSTVRHSVPPPPARLLDISWE